MYLYSLDPPSHVSSFYWSLYLLIPSPFWNLCPYKTHPRPYKTQAQVSKGLLPNSSSAARKRRDAMGKGKGKIRRRESPISDNIAASTRHDTRPLSCTCFFKFYFRHRDFQKFSTVIHWSSYRLADMLICWIRFWTKDFNDACDLTYFDELEMQ